MKQLEYLDLRSARVTLVDQAFIVREFAARDLFAYLGRLREIREDGENLETCVDGILQWVLGVEAAWLASVDLGEKLAVLGSLKTLNDLDEPAEKSSGHSNRQVTWDEACDVVGARYGLSPLEIWATFPLRLIRRYYTHAIRAVEREHWFFRRLHGDTTPEPRWLYGDPDEQDVQKQLRSEEWRALKARHEAMRGRPRVPIASSNI